MEKWKKLKKNEKKNTMREREEMNKWEKNEENEKIMNEKILGKEEWMKK